VRLPGGAFTMGRTAAESDEECAALGKECHREIVERSQPAHRVSLAPFFLDVDEVTNEAFIEWMRTLTPRTEEDPDHPAEHIPRFVYDRAGGALVADLHREFGGIEMTSDRRFSLRPGFEKKPVIQVTWDAARAYCTAQGKRLPTEAEWEFAARGTTARLYPWGDAAPTCDGTIFGRDADYACANLPAGPAPVTDGVQDRTPEGIHGLSGNVSEWVEDAFVAPYLPDCGACENPIVQPPTSGAATVRVMRGGAWANTNLSRTSARGRWPQNSPAQFLGFRCAVSAE
jgi:formylglycine-generating enzyme required for sulfatase activity